MSTDLHFHSLESFESIQDNSSSTLECISSLQRFNDKCKTGGELLSDCMSQLPSIVLSTLGALPSMSDSDKSSLSHHIEVTLSILRRVLSIDGISECSKARRVYSKFQSLCQSWLNRADTSTLMMEFKSLIDQSTIRHDVAVSVIIMILVAIADSLSGPFLPHPAENIPHILRAWVPLYTFLRDRASCRDAIKHSLNIERVVCFVLKHFSTMSPGIVRSVHESVKRYVNHSVVYCHGQLFQKKARPVGLTRDALQLYTKQITGAIHTHAQSCPQDQEWLTPISESFSRLYKAFAVDPTHCISILIDICNALMEALISRETIQYQTVQ